ncbi:MAG: pilin [Patescibacteria group bacterium]
MIQYKRLIPLVILPALILLPLAYASAQAKLESPFVYKTVSDFISAVLRAIVYLSMPIIALFIMYAGFKYILARGNPGAIDEAHKNFMYVIIGALLILGAWVLATLIGGTVSQLVTK